MTRQQVVEIIERTAQKIRTDLYNYETHPNRPNGTWNNEMGYGLVDAHAAVLMAQSQEYGGTVNLMVRDNLEDVGTEPHTVDVTWESPDIWIRNQADNGLEHQNPIQSATNYVYVRVKNISSCASSSISDKLVLHWSKASSSMSWPNDWDGYFPNNGPLRGGVIGEVEIPVLEPGAETILQLEWNNIPNAQDYASIDLVGAGNEWHFCLLARIESEADPMTFEENEYTHLNVKNNNNIAQKNVHVIEVQNKTEGSFLIGNSTDTQTSFDLTLEEIKSANEKFLFEEAELTIVLSQSLYNAWVTGGRTINNILELEENLFLVKGGEATFQNLILPRHEMGLMQLNVNFLTSEITSKSDYHYRFTQSSNTTNEIVGGESFHIIKNNRQLFFANAGNEIYINKDDLVTLSADLIDEPAVYNWYDENGVLVFEGASFETSLDLGKKYKLEIITNKDGYKDYSEVEIKLLPNNMPSVYPNPVSDVLTVEYQINEGSSAYLSLMGLYGTHVIHNYILNLEETTTTLNVANLPLGIYTLALIVDGQLQALQTILKQ